MYKSDFPAKLFYQHVAILLCCHVVQWYILYQAGFEIPMYIPQTPISIGGLGILITIIVVSYFYAKACFKSRMDYTIVDVGLSLLAVFTVSEILFQLIRIPMLENLSNAERVYLYFNSVITVSLFSGFFGVLVILKVKGGYKKLFNFLVVAVGIVSYLYGRFILKI